jgi:hypothetical protein
MKVVFERNYFHHNLIKLLINNCWTTDHTLDSLWSIEYLMKYGDLNLGVEFFDSIALIILTEDSSRDWIYLIEKNRNIYKRTPCGRRRA